MNWSPLILSFKLALTTSALLFVLGIPLAHWLAYGKSRFRLLVEPLTSMPLVLPPTVLGFYLLMAFSPKSTLGTFLEDQFDFQLAFSFGGLVIASIIYSLPFMVQPLLAGFKKIPREIREASFLLGKSRWTTLLKVTLPNMKASLLSGFILAFAHTLGEFGVVLMIGGSIPDQTKVASIAIYEEVEAMNYSQANGYSLFLIGSTFIILLLVRILNNRKLSEA